MSRFTRFMMRAPIGLYRVGLGGLLGRRFLLLEHTGRRSGVARRTMLEVMERDDTDAPIIVSGFGDRSDWYRNITADPAVAYTSGRRRVEATAKRLGPAEALAVFERYRVEHPKAAAVIGRRLGVSLVDDLEAAAAVLPLFRLAPR
jgi:deazaflavin-dependent oxidoreductase (nitroreductase family)